MLRRAASFPAPIAAFAAAAALATSALGAQGQAGRPDGRSVTDIVPAPAVTAKAWLVYDDTTDEPVAAKDPSTPRPIASLAKLMTALVVVEQVQAEELVTVPAAIGAIPADAAVMGLRVGERWPAGDLLRAMLVYSANDAAITLASHVGSGDVAAFVELMNERAEQLDLSGTTFASPTGLDAPGATSTSTPVDLVALAETALRDTGIRTAVAAPKLELRRPDGSTPPIVLPNRNPLLGRYEGVDGVKTGFTDAAGYMLVAHHEDPETGGQLLVVTAGSSSEATRASDATALLDWARPLRQDVLLVEGGAELGSIPVLRSSRRVDVFACDDLVVSARVGQRVEQRVTVPRLLDAPVREGDEIGTLGARVAGQDVASVPICSGDTIRAGGWTGRVRMYAGEYRSAWRAGLEEVEDAWHQVKASTG